MLRILIEQALLGEIALKLFVIVVDSFLPITTASFRERAAIVVIKVAGVYLINPICNSTNHSDRCNAVYVIQKASFVRSGCYD
jgi:hypothetical protein